MTTEHGLGDPCDGDRGVCKSKIANMHWHHLHSFCRLEYLRPQLEKSGDKNRRFRKTWPITVSSVPQLVTELYISVAQIHLFGRFGGFGMTMMFKFKFRIH
jgi:hypothetical protein